MKMSIKRCIFGSLFVILLFGFFVTITPVEAGMNHKLKSIIRDNFNKYTNGSIVGQGGWFNRANGLPYVIQSLVKKEGRKALYNNNIGADSVITKTSGTALVNGKQSFYIRTENRSNWGTYNIGENVQLGLFQGSWDGSSRAVLTFRKDGHVAYIDPNIDTWVNFDTYTDNSWTLVDVEWRSIDNTVRYRANNGAWTGWVPFVGSSFFTGFDTVGFVTFYLGTGGVYIDALE